MNWINFIYYFIQIALKYQAMLHLLTNDAGTFFQI